MLTAHHPLRALGLTLLAWLFCRTGWSAEQLEQTPVVPQQQSGTSERPNLLVILVDDLGFGDLGCFGRADAPTPHINRLAAEGIRFTHFYVASPECSPSRAALLTGRYPAEIRIHRAFGDLAGNRQRGMPNWLDPKLPNLARGLAARGYRCHQFGKWHLGSFEAEGLPEPSAYGFHTSRTSAELNATSDRREERSQASARVVDAFLEQMNSAGAESDAPAPWFALVSLPDMHHPLLPSEEQLAPFVRFDPRYIPWPGPQAIFDAALAEMDRQIGRLLAGLEERGMAANTLVLLLSDNGPETSEVALANHAAAGSTGPFRGRKTSLYEGGIRVPLIARWPQRVPAGRIDDAAVLSTIDFLPSLLAIGGRSASPEELGLARGEDVRPALFGQAFERQRPLLWEWRFPTRGHPSDSSPRLAIRRGRLKLLANPNGSRLELYDLTSDPYELNNLARSDPASTQALLAELRRWHSALPADGQLPGAGRLPLPWPGEIPPPPQPGATSDQKPSAGSEQEER
jgi:arylsulfatase A-like enzyme